MLHIACLVGLNGVFRTAEEKGPHCFREKGRCRQAGISVPSYTALGAGYTGHYSTLS